MADLQKIYPPRKILPSSSTIPPKVIDLKFKLADGSSYDGDITGFDTIEIDFVFADASYRSPADQYLIEILNLDTSEIKSQVLNNKKPFYYWQRHQETKGRKVTDISDTEIQNGVVNAQIVITPVNSRGIGRRSTFFMPMRNLDFISDDYMERNPSLLVLAKYWHLFSKTPESVLNRPKVMHVYLNTPDEDILLDKELLSQPEQFFNTVGDYKTVNQEQYRWIINELSDTTEYKLLESVNNSDSFRAMTQEEQEFINLLLGTFNDRYQEFIALNNIDRGQPHMFKIAVKNPRDHDDSIIIYLMKGQRWQQ